MPAGKWKLYNSAKQNIGDGTTDLNSHSFKIALFTSASDANTLTETVYSGLTNEVAGANGYTTGGQTLAGVTWSQTGGVATFDATDVTWTASGGSITARFAVIYDDTAATKPLVCVCLLDTAPADVTATAGNTLTIQFNASGIFTLSGATTDA
jgi:hypothetical protein